MTRNDNKLALAGQEIKELWERLEELSYFVQVPEANCRCHLSPPCNDCTDNSFARRILEELAERRKEEQK